MGVPSVSDVLSIPTRWGGFNNGVSSIANYLGQQRQAQQSIQLQQAQQLAQYKTYYDLQSDPQSQAISQRISALLAQNPYGRALAGQNMGQALQPAQQPQPQADASQNTPTQGQSQGGVTPLSGANAIQPLGGSPISMGNSPGMSGVLNPIGNQFGGGNVSTGGSMSQKFGQPPTINSNFSNPQGDAAVQSAKSQAEANVQVPAQYGKDIMASKAKENAAYATLDSLSDNLVGNIKSAMIQSGGGGFMPDMVGKLAAGPLGQALGMSDNTSAITAMNAVKRDTAIAYARNLAGGSQGVQKLMERVLDTMPDQGMTPQQAASSLAEMKMTGLALKNGIDKLKLTPDQMDSMTADQFQALADSAKSLMGPDQQNQVLSGIYKSMANVPARLQGDMFTGKTFEPQTNPLSKKIGMDFNPTGGNKLPTAQTGQGSQPQSMANKIPQYNPKTQKLQQNTKTGEYRVVNL